MHYCDLKLPVDPFIKPLQPDLYDLLEKDLTNLRGVYKDEINPEFIKFLNGYDLDVAPYSTLFCTAPGFVMPVHMDGMKFHNGCTMNFVWGSDKHVMKWYSLKEGISKDNVQLVTDPAFQETYLFFDEDNLIEIDSHYVKFPTLVKNGIPHNIINLGKSIRYCLALDIKWKNDDKHFFGFDFDKAVEILKEYHI